MNRLRKGMKEKELPDTTRVENRPTCRLTISRRQSKAARRRRPLNYRVHRGRLFAIATAVAGTRYVGRPRGERTGDSSAVFAKEATRYRAFYEGKVSVVPLSCTSVCVCMLHVRVSSTCVYVAWRARVTRLRARGTRRGFGSKVL